MDGRSRDAVYGGMGEVKRVLLTGATGFLGDHLTDHILRDTDWEIVAFARNPRKGVQLSRVTWLKHDLLDPVPEWLIQKVGKIDYIVHAGAEVSGINSIVDPVKSVRTNVYGTFHLLETARKLKPKSFIYVSTGEAVGATNEPDGLSEDAPLKPSNPYAASKAAGEELVRVYVKSYGVPAAIVRSMNLFGERQSLDRFIPMIATKMLRHEPITCHVAPNGMPGSRNWLPIETFVAWLVDVLDLAVPGGVYHLVGPERNNLQIIHLVSSALDAEPKIETRVPGATHDIRYALKNTKLNLTWHGEFEKAVFAAARWYR